MIKSNAAEENARMLAAGAIDIATHLLNTSWEKKQAQAVNENNWTLNCANQSQSPADRESFLKVPEPPTPEEYIELSERLTPLLLDRYEKYLEIASRYSET